MCISNIKKPKIKLPTVKNDNSNKGKIIIISIVVLIFIGGITALIVWTMSTTATSSSPSPPPVTTTPTPTVKCCASDSMEISCLKCKNSKCPDTHTQFKDICVSNLAVCGSKNVVVQEQGCIGGTPDTLNTSVHCNTFKPPHCPKIDGINYVETYNKKTPPSGFFPKDFKFTPCKGFGTLTFCKLKK